MGIAFSEGMKTTFNQTLPAAELKLGDVIQVLDGPFGTAIVSKVERDEIKLYRPYGTNADFSCTSGVICYVGIEEFSVPRSQTKTYFVYDRQELA